MADRPTPEQTAEQTRQAAAELPGLVTVADLRAWWKRYYLTLGHKRLARLAILEWPVDRILADKSRD